MNESVRVSNPGEMTVAPDAGRPFFAAVAASLATFCLRMRRTR